MLLILVVFLMGWLLAEQNEDSKWVRWNHREGRAGNWRPEGWTR